MAHDCLVDHNPSPHDHPEHPQENQRANAHKRLKWALGICLSLLVVEVIGGILTGSLALLADATHMLTDASALGIALLAGYLAQKLNSSRQSYGFYRLEILAALLNGFLLLAMAAFIFIEAYERLFQVKEVNGMGMLVVGSFGLLANLIMLKLMHQSHDQDLNTRAAFFHILGDSLASVAVIVGAGCILLTGSYWPDTLASAFVAMLLVIVASKLIWESVQILLEGTPKHMNPDAIQSQLIEKFTSIESIHDFHIWEITSHLFAMTAHIEANVDSLEETKFLIDGINEFIRQEYGIGHTTFQVEPILKKKI